MANTPWIILSTPANEVHRYAHQHLSRRAGRPHRGITWSWEEALRRFEVQWGEDVADSIRAHRVKDNRSLPMSSTWLRRLPSLALRLELVCMYSPLVTLRQLTWLITIHSRRSHVASNGEVHFVVNNEWWVLSVRNSIAESPRDGYSAVCSTRRMDLVRLWKRVDHKSAEGRWVVYRCWFPRHCNEWIVQHDTVKSMEPEPCISQPMMLKTWRSRSTSATWHEPSKL